MKAVKSNMRDQILTNDEKVLHCSSCDSIFSGNAGDYWDLPKNYIFCCSNCEVEMELVKRRVTIKYED